MFTPVESALGAVLLQQASTTFLFNNGCVLGASGQLRGLLTSPSAKNTTLILGMALSLFAVKILFPSIIPIYPDIERNWHDSSWIIGVGVLTGYGTKNCNGCTSGHMLCGISRLSARSLVATIVFMVVTYATHHFLEPLPTSINCPAGIECYKPVYPQHDTAISLGLMVATTIAGVHLIPSLTFRVTKNKEVAGLASRAVVGFAFGLGLLVSGFADPAKVLSFFSISFGPLEITSWDPSLGFVGIFAIIPNIVWWNWLSPEPPSANCGTPPKYTARYELPTTVLSSVNIRFLVGAVLFGLAWGASGSCPGPAILRALWQPSWGLLWMGGFLLGSLLPF